MERAERYVSKMIAMIKRPEMRILPGELAFFLVMSLIPLAALLGAIASSLSIDVSSFEELMKGTIPPAVASFIVDIMNNKTPDFNITMFFISAFILASNGPHSMIVASNEIYKIKPRDFITRRLKAILMTLVMVGLFFILFLIPIFGDYIFELITTNITDLQVHRFMFVVFQLIKYPLLVVVLHYNIKLLYIIAPDDKIKSMTTTKGSIFTTIGWIIATEVYSVYIGAFTSYDKFYGSISNLVILFLWVYILAYIFVLGMIINAGSYRARKEEEEKVVE
ncbi:MAG: YihY/virulence factor BrkB family protein [Bacilli bacterium]|nr:YihY/virulence factor BrkB family protein [Bacilli bacterium]